MTLLLFIVSGQLAAGDPSTCGAGALVAAHPVTLLLLLLLLLLFILSSQIVLLVSCIL